MSQTRSIGPLGTIVRLMLSPFFSYFGFNSPIAHIAYPNQLNYSLSHWDDLLFGVLIVPAVLALWQYIRQKYSPKPLRALGPIGTILNTVITVILFFTPLHHSLWFFLGLSLFIAAIRGYGGCEVLAISNWITGRNDQVGCVILSPIDAIEKATSQKK